MAQISVTNLTFSYGGSENIFDDVSFDFDTSWKCGLIGRNGVGKTTFLKLLQNEYSYQGNISMNMSTLYFPFDVKDKSIQTINVVDDVLGMYDLWRLNKELNLLSVPEEVLYRSFDSLSYGEQVKVMLAMLFVKDYDYLLIDEPTNHLDYEGRLLVSNYLKSKDGFLLVSHDRMFLDACIDHVIALNRTSIEVRAGSFDAWYQDKMDKDAFEISKNARLRKEVKRLDEAFKSAERASEGIEKTKYGQGVRNSSKGKDRGFIGAKAARKMKSAKNLEGRKFQALEERRGLLQDVEEVDDLKLSLLPYHQDSMIQFIDVSLGYDGQPVLEHLNFHLMTNHILQIKGGNGSGKSTIIKAIMEELDILDGQVFRGSNIKVSYVPQSATHLKGSLEDLVEKHDIDKSQFMSILAKMGVDRSHFESDIETYSEGQKKKVLLAVSLCEEAHLYIWDEPLNYIDIFTRIQIENLIEQYQPTILFVEHDELFAENVRSNIIQL